MATTDATPEAPSEVRAEVYDDYDAFLKQAVREYYNKGWKSRRGNFIALVIASGQILSMAGDSVREGTGLKRAALGAAGVVALRFFLRYFLGGPVGLLLSAAVVASAVAYFVKNQKEIQPARSPPSRPSSPRTAPSSRRSRAATAPAATTTPAAT